VSREQTVYILHSNSCVASGIDPRRCIYSRMLDKGIHAEQWVGWEDKPVTLGMRTRHGLIPETFVAEESP